MHARFDARSTEFAVPDRVVRLVDEWRCVFLTSQVRIVEPTLAAVWVELELYPASSFVQNADAFLDRLRQHRERGGERPNAVGGSAGRFIATLRERGAGLTPSANFRADVLPWAQGSYVER